MIDIESTCWPGGFPPRGEANDMIEIGLVPLEVASGRRLEKRSILVRPERWRVRPFCTELTTLTQKQVDGGIAFKDACRILEDEYLSRERLCRDSAITTSTILGRKGIPEPLTLSYIRYIFGVLGKIEVGMSRFARR